MFIIVIGPDQWVECHQMNIAGGRNLLEDNKKGSEEGYITLVDLVDQVGHYTLLVK